MKWKVNKYCTLLGSNCKGDKCIQAVETQRIDLYHDQSQRIIVRVRRTGLFGLLKKTERVGYVSHGERTTRYRVIKSQKSATLQCRHFNKQIADMTEDAVDVEPQWDMSGVSTSIAFIDSGQVAGTLDPEVKYIDEPYDMSVIVMGGLMLTMVAFAVFAAISIVLA